MPSRGWPLSPRLWPIRLRRPDLHRSPAPTSATTSPPSRRSAPRRSVGRRIRIRRAGRPGCRCRSRGPGRATRPNRPTSCRWSAPRPRNPARGRTGLNRTGTRDPTTHRRRCTPTNGGGGRHRAEAEQDGLPPDAQRTEPRGGAVIPNARRSDPPSPASRPVEPPSDAAPLPRREPGMPLSSAVPFQNLGAATLGVGAAAPAAGRTAERRPAAGAAGAGDARLRTVHRGDGRHPGPAGRRSRRRREQPVANVGGPPARPPQPLTSGRAVGGG